MSTSIQNGSRMEGIKEVIIPALIPATSSMVAIVPVFYGLIAKSAQQKSALIPLQKVREVFMLSLKAAPSVGALVGSQIVAQDLIEKRIVQFRGTKDLTAMISSAGLVGLITAPFSVVLNGLTLKKTAALSLKEMTLAQALAITVRETTFLAAIRISQPLSEIMKEKLGEGNVAEVCSSFLSGVIGSLAGHPADTYLTRQQARLKTHARDLMRGSIIKSATLGSFTILYNEAKDIFKSI